ncbi:MAG: alpha/beta hydrolase [Chloroflexi bacterium]|nr:alpha/beta hydrolase [Chloroflexota bacterium]
MRRRTRVLLIAILVLLFLAFVLPFLIPLDSSGTDPRVFADVAGRFIDVDGVSTYIVEKGDPAEPAVIFLHGLYGSTWVWRNNLDAIAEAGYHVIAFDRPGAGLSAKPADFNYSHANNADFTAHLLDALNIDTAVIVGHSAGGNVLAHFALRHPDRVARLIIVDGAILGANGPPPFVGGIVGFPPITRWARIGTRLGLTEASVRSTVASFHADPAFLTDIDFAGYWRAFQTPDWDMGLIGLTRDSAGNKLSEAQVAEIEARTLLLWGEADQWTSLDNGRLLALTLVNSEIITYPNTGHQPMEEAAADFNEDVIAFLNAD